MPTRTSGRAFAALPRARGRPAPRAVGARRDRRRASCSPGRRRAASSAWPSRRSTAAAASATSASTRSSARRSARAGVGGAGLGITLHNDICLPYFLRLLQRGAAGSAGCPASPSGELITAIAMTEPGIGSDLAAHAHHGRPRRRRLRRQRRQDVHHQRHQRRPGHHRGQDRPRRAPPRHAACWSSSAGMAGFERGRNLEKLGQHAQDTAELFFTDVAGPGGQPARRGGPGLQPARRQPAPGAAVDRALPAVAAAGRALDWTLAYVQERTAFGQPVGSFQNTRFALAELRHRGRHRPGLHRPLRRGAQRRAS